MYILYLVVNETFSLGMLAVSNLGEFSENFQRAQFDAKSARGQFAAAQSAGAQFA